MVGIDVSLLDELPEHARPDLTVVGTVELELVPGEGVFRATVPFDPEAVAAAVAAVRDGR